MFETLKRFFTNRSAQGVIAASAVQDAFLSRCKGVIHVGANLGQEREIYAAHRLPVVWFEPLPSVFEELKRNIAPFPGQTAVRALLAARDNETHMFRVSNNGGESSSILELKHHRDIWPEVHFVEEIEMRSLTLPTALALNKIDPACYDALVMDTQGSELLILQGAESILSSFDFVKTEAADFESYGNCATVETLSEFLGARGYRLARSDKFAQHTSLGAYYNLLFERTAPG